METTHQLIPAPKSEARPGCLSEMGWLASGAVLPIGSLSFYRKASQRKVGMAILFFFLFTGIIAILQTIATGISMASVVKDIRSAYNSGEVPELTIHNGIATANGKQPYVLTDQSSTGTMLIAIDTTGQITSIDRSRYTQGFLITRTELQVLSNTGQYHSFPLSELQATFNKDPILINGDTVANAWKIFSVILAIFVFVFLILWNSVVRLMFIAVVALVIWGVASLFRPKIGFGPFIITGLYAVVPAVYLSHLLNRIDASFLGLQTILLVAFWILGLVASLAQDKFFSGETPLRLWMAWLGVPMLLLLVVDLFISSPSVFWKIVLWAVALLTGLVLVGLRLFFRAREMEKPASPTGTLP